jgi:hypothetical protein
MKTAILVLLAVLVAGTCWSDGNILLENCMGIGPELEAAYPGCDLPWTMCYAYIMGVLEISEHRGTVCSGAITPEERRAMQREAKDVVIVYLQTLKQREPKLMYQAAAPLVWAALHERWPCR